MKRLKIIAASALAVILVGALALTALASDDYGSAAVEDSGTYTLEEMLTYAIQDEYLAYAEYEEIIDTFGAARPFTNIIKAEATHIAELTVLFEAYGYTLPENTAAEHVIVPDDLSDALSAGVQAEINNIAMYDVFLSQTLPDDVRAVFEDLQVASEKHLAAFERGLARPSENGSALGTGYGAGNRNENASGYGSNDNAESGYGYECDDCEEYTYGYGSDDCNESGSYDCDESGSGSQTGSGYMGDGKGANQKDTCSED